VPMPNGTGIPFAGVFIVGTDHNVVGGDEPGAGNVIAGNEGDGVLIDNAFADSNRVAGNWIGTNPAADGLGNSLSGVMIGAGDRNAVDGGNVIAYNGGDGVTVEETALENVIVGNAIFANGDGVDDLGIDLNADGVTLNDALDADAGANNLQNHPTIAVASNIAAGTKVEWALDSLASTSFRLDFYASDACDDSGHGEGQVHLGSANVVTDAAGHAAGNTIPTIAAAPGQQITMTATRTVAGDTSEFSPCQPVA